MMNRERCFGSTILGLAALTAVIIAGQTTVAPAQEANTDDAMKLLEEGTSVPLGCIVSKNCWNNWSGPTPESILLGRRIERPSGLAGNKLKAGAPTAKGDDLVRTTKPSCSVEELVRSVEALAKREKATPQKSGSDGAKLSAGDYLAAQPIQDITTRKRLECDLVWLLKPGATASIEEWLEFTSFSEKYQRVGKYPLDINSKIKTDRQSPIAKACERSYELVSGLTTNRVPVSRARLIELTQVLYAAYIANCFRADLSALGKAADRLVLFLRRPLASPWQTYCMGFNFRDNLVLTARHCLIDPGRTKLFLKDHSSGDGADGLRVRGLLPGTRLLVAGEARLYRARIPDPTILKQSLIYNPFAPHNDTAIVEIVPETTRNHVPPFKMIAAKRFQRLHMPGVFVDGANIVRALKEDKTGSAFRKLWRQKVRVDTSQTCRIHWDRKNWSCLYHECQTIGGFSGTPLLAMSEVDGQKVLALVGVHVGAASPGATACGFARSSLFPNYGLRLPTNILATQN